MAKVYVRCYGSAEERAIADFYKGIELGSGIATTKSELKQIFEAQKPAGKQFVQCFDEDREPIDTMDALDSLPSDSPSHPRFFKSQMS